MSVSTIPGKRLVHGLLTDMRVSGIREAVGEDALGHRGNVAQPRPQQGLAL